nr:MAG TPA: hypothetical protein [Caudoviricetes sp.]
MHIERLRLVRGLSIFLLWATKEYYEEIKGYI